MAGFYRDRGREAGLGRRRRAGRLWQYPDLFDGKSRRRIAAFDPFFDPPLFETAANAKAHRYMHKEILSFWFEEIAPSQWWAKDDAFDQSIRARFAHVHARAARCELYEWRAEPRGRLAEVIVLDQFSRNLFRGSPLAFASDPLALALAQEAVAAKAEEALSPVERSFLYLPFMHSESPAIHAVAIELYRKNGIQSNFDFEIKHKQIIDRFGRYPHRNAILGRQSTQEEIEFLKQPGSGF